MTERTPPREQTASLDSDGYRRYADEREDYTLEPSLEHRSKSSTKHHSNHHSKHSSRHSSKHESARSQNRESLDIQEAVPRRRSHHDRSTRGKAKEKEDNDRARTARKQKLGAQKPKKHLLTMATLAISDRRAERNSERRPGRRSDRATDSGSTATAAMHKGAGSDTASGRASHREPETESLSRAEPRKSTNAYRPEEHARIHHPKNRGGGPTTAKRQEETQTAKTRWGQKDEVKQASEYGGRHRQSQSGGSQKHQVQEGIRYPEENLEQLMGQLPAYIACSAHYRARIDEFGKRFTQFDTDIAERMKSLEIKIKEHLSAEEGIGGSSAREPVPQETSRTENESSNYSTIQENQPSPGKNDPKFELPPEVQAELPKWIGSFAKLEQYSAAMRPSRSPTASTASTAVADSAFRSRRNAHEGSSQREGSDRDDSDEAWRSGRMSHPRQYGPPYPLDDFEY